MVVIHRLAMDLLGKEQTPWIEVSQWDINTREIRLLLFEGKKVWHIPDDAQVLIQYQKPDGDRGAYDTLPNGDRAWGASDNMLTLRLAPQLLTIPGKVMLSASIIREDEILNTFEVEICVRPALQNEEYVDSPDEVYGITGVMPAPEFADVGQYIRVLEVNSAGKVIRVEAVDLQGSESISQEELERTIESYLQENPPAAGKDGYTPIKGVDYFTDADKAEIVDAVKNETKQKYGKLIVFGDSLGEGTSNNNYSFVDILGESGEFSSVVKACRNSATIGPYSADYAVGYDLISQIERYASDVADADIIMCEYQFNDINAIIAGAVNMGYKGDSETDNTVCGYMKRALNRIRELNPTAHITWVLSGKYDFNRAIFGNDMVDLLLLFEATALTLARNYSVGIISIMEESFGEGLVSSDGLHPNTAGHKRIAQIILNNLYGNSDIILPERTLMLTGDLSRPETMSIDGSIINIMQMLVAGIRVRMVYDGGDGAIMFDATLAGADGLVLNATAGNLGSYTILWSMDGSIEFMYDSNSGGGSSGGTVSWNDLTDKPDIPTDEHINSLIDEKLGTADEYIVTCDMEGSTEDESTIPLNADTLGGYLPSAFVKSGYVNVNTTLSGAYGFPSSSYAQCTICGNVAMITFDITPNTISADGWQTFAETELQQGASVFARFTNSIDASAIQREFFFDGQSLKAFLVKGDKGQRFTGTMITFSDMQDSKEVTS